MSSNRNVIQPKQIDFDVNQSKSTAAENRMPPAIVGKDWEIDCLATKNVTATYSSHLIHLKSLCSTCRLFVDLIPD